MFCHSVDSLSLAGRRKVYISRLGHGVEYACDDFVAAIEVGRERERERERGRGRGVAQ
jgi:hypothetical protein